MTAVKAVRDYVRYMCRASEQAERYRWKLNMLRTPEWRARVLKDLGGMKALTRWINQPPPHKAFRPKRRPLSAKRLAQRERMKLCAKASAHPRIFRDPCRLDQEGIFRLPTKRRHILRRIPRHPLIIEHEYTYDARPVYQLAEFSEPITIWPDEFLAFEDLQDELAALDQKALSDEAAERKRISAKLQTAQEGFDLLKCNFDLTHVAPERAKVYAPP